MVSTSVNKVWQVQKGKPLNITGFWFPDRGMFEDAKEKSPDI